MVDSEAKRVVLATHGSLGDLCPLLALALELAARGHHPVITSNESLRHRVEQAGVEFRSMRPDVNLPSETSHVIDRSENLRRSGALRFIRENELSHLRATYEDLLSVCQDADMLISYPPPPIYVAPLVAEKLRLRWAVAFVRPSSVWSMYDPPVIAGQPGLTWLCRRSPLVARLALDTGRASMRRLLQQPMDELRAAVGLAPARSRLTPSEGFPPELRLALFSPLLAQPQKDWPPNTLVTGSVFYDGGPGQATLPAALEAFVGSGPPPIVFTLGSLVWADARDFYDISAAAATALGYRVVLLTGAEPTGQSAVDAASGVIRVAYAAHAPLFPRAAAIVHHGGIGTLGQALHAGRPMLIVPFAFDQPDNAARAVRLGVARTIQRERYTVERVTRELRELLEKPAYAQRATEVAGQIRAEDGVGVACDAIEECLCRKRNHSI